MRMIHLPSKDLGDDPIHSIYYTQNPLPLCRFFASTAFLHQIPKYRHFILITAIITRVNIPLQWSGITVHEQAFVARKITCLK